MNNSYTKSDSNFQIQQNSYFSSAVVKPSRQSFKPKLNIEYKFSEPPNELAKKSGIEKQQLLQEFLKQQKLEFNDFKQIENDNLQKQKTIQKRKEQIELSGGMPRHLGQLFKRHVSQQQEFDKQGFWPMKKPPSPKKKKDYEMMQKPEPWNHNNSIPSFFQSQNAHVKEVKDDSFYQSQINSHNLSVKNQIISRNESMFKIKPNHQFNIIQSMTEQNPYQTQTQIVKQKQQQRNQIMQGAKTVPLHDSIIVQNKNNNISNFNNNKLSNYINSDIKNEEYQISKKRQILNQDQMNARRSSQSIRISILQADQQRPVSNLQHRRNTNQNSLRNIGTSHSKLSSGTRKSNIKSAISINNQSQGRISQAYSKQSLKSRNSENQNENNKQWKHFNNIYQTFETQLHDNIYIKLDQRKKKIEKAFKPTKTKLGYFGEFQGVLEKHQVKTPMEVKINPSDFHNLQVQEEL